jgi:histidinol-phosphate aminotransferase
MSERGPKLARWLRPELMALDAYHVPQREGFVKLDAMENPYPWPESMVDEWLERLRDAALNRYPDPSAARLKAALRSHDRVPEGAELLLGNGSDELIQMVLMAIAGRDTTVLAPEPTFVMYRQISAGLGIRFIGVPLRREDFALDMEAMRQAIRHHQPGVIFLAYPNNPTGNLFAADAIAEILARAPGFLIVDEAYAPFTEASLMPQLAEHEHLLVMRTVSKLGLAGLRLGFLAGAAPWIRQLDKLRLPYNVNVLTQISVEFALAHYAVLDEQIRKIRRDRETLFQSLSELNEVVVYPSQANFLLFRLKQGDADAVFRALKDAGVLIKNLHKASGPLRNCLRVTVGTHTENQRFLQALKQHLLG